VDTSKATRLTSVLPPHVIVSHITPPLTITPIIKTTETIIILITEDSTLIITTITTTIIIIHASNKTIPKFKNMHVSKQDSYENPANH